jgi:hypothetical protein
MAFDISDDVTPSGAHVGASRRQQSHFMSLLVAARRAPVRPESPTT